jgi:acyl-CoA synthetase (AMP-forming)/AMP-acid ligase II/peptidoglycan/LPS O-acetylase OafA/YrhL
VPSPSAVLADQERAPRFARALGEHGPAPALVHPEGTTWSHAELAHRADEVAEALGPQRRLVAVDAAVDPGAVVAHLGALRGGHVVVLLPPAGPSATTLVEAWDPDVVLAGAPGGDVAVRERRTGSAHELHPDLTLLLGTSGSTGAPKLVRLGGAGVEANARAIVEYLGLRSSDRAALTLPMHYCYGLSVLHSHLAAGASVVVGGGSVVDPCFWERFRRHGCTSLAGVPHTFELLDRVGLDRMELPTLRQITQAGGRLAPDEVRRWAAVAARDGWELVVMYGQTEATARMAYLPPELAAGHAGTIGRPIPGGELWIEPVDGVDHDDGVGELVYRGPNVMMGYARTASDLAAGRDVHVLRTGDLARERSDGLFEVVGRLSRLVKPFGVRVDLDHVEQVLAEDGVTCVCTGDDALLVVGLLDATASVGEVAARLRSDLGLPRAAVSVVVLDERPLLPNGKTDHTAVLAAGRAALATEPSRTVRTGEDRSSVRDVLASVLAVERVDDDDTFVSLGGDSLSYVEVSTELEEVLGELPQAWHTTPVARLEAAAAPGQRRVAVVEGNVALRAVAIALVVGTHASLFRLQGGAHVLLAVAGFNFARFRLTGRETAARVRHSAASIARIAVPSVAWVCFMFTWREPFSLPRLLLVDNVAGDGLWRYWYVEVLLQLLVLLTFVLGVRGLREAERRAPFGAALAVLGATLAVRFALVPWPQPDEPMYRTDTVAWLFALGWAAERARQPLQRALVSVAVLVAVPGFFDAPARAWLVAIGLVVLVWVPVVRVPRPLNRVVAALAGASFAIFLTHFAVLPWLRPHLPPVAIWAAALGVGVAVSLLADRARPRSRLRTGASSVAVAAAPAGRDEARRPVARDGTPVPAPRALAHR